MATLERRPRTAAELRQVLAARGFDDAIVDSVVERMLRAGFVDDRALAVQYLVSRAERLGHAPSRLVAELRARGVPAAVLHDAEREAREVHGIDARDILRREVERRGAAGSSDPARIRRAYQALLRAGHEPDDIRAVLSGEGACEIEP